MRLVAAGTLFSAICGMWTKNMHVISTLFCLCRQDGVHDHYWSQHGRKVDVYSPGMYICLVCALLYGVCITPQGFLSVSVSVSMSVSVYQFGLMFRFVYG